MTASSPTTPEQLVQRSVAVEQMYATVADLGLTPRIALSLHMHNLTRAEYGMFDGDEETYPSSLAEGGTLWVKTVTLWEAQTVDGEFWPSVLISLFTHEPPATVAA